MKNGQVFIDGGRLEESYLNKDHSCYDDPVSDFAPLTVPADEVFVMGDNRCNSDDSRDPRFGPIATSSIIGRAFAIVWPLGRIDFL
jgi:signal peptidase I